MRSTRKDDPEQLPTSDPRNPGYEPVIQFMAICDHCLIPTPHRQNPLGIWICDVCKRWDGPKVD